MALLLETTLGDLIIDLDIEGSPALCRNVLELAQARYYTSTLIYNIQANRFCQLGDPHGDGTGGACWQGVLDQPQDVTKSKKRFLKSQGRALTSTESQEKGRVVATEMKGIPDTIGSQFLITLAEGPGMALDGYTMNDEKEGETQHSFLSLGKVTEDDDNVLDQLKKMYCDSDGRPYADVRVKRALVVHNPFDDPPQMQELMKIRGVELDDGDDELRVIASPDFERPPEERVEPRVPVDQVDLVDDENEEKLARLQKQQEEEAIQHETRSRAVVLEMLGDLPSAEIKAPENVLFVCKLNSVTEDDDLELIFSRFDPSVKAEIIRDHDTGASLQYAFVEFTKKQQAVEAYFKMNNALVDDRRIKVDFSQSVAKIWDKYNQKLKPSALPGMNENHGGRGNSGGGRGGRGARGGRGRGGRGRGYHDDRGRRREDYGRRGPPEQQRNRDSNNGDKRRDSGHQGDRRHPEAGIQHERRDSRGHHDGPSRNLDEFGRVHGEINGRQSRSRSLSPEDRHRRRRPSRSLSHSRNQTVSPDNRRRRRSRSVSPQDRRRRSRSRDHHRKHEKHSRKHKKKKRKHEGDRHRRRDDSESPESEHDRYRKRRYDSDDEEDQGHGKQRRDSEHSRDSGEKRRKHSKHHKRRKRSRSR